VQTGLFVEIQAVLEGGSVRQNRKIKIYTCKTTILFVFMRIVRLHNLCLESLSFHVRACKMDGTNEKWKLIQSFSQKLAPTVTAWVTWK
jgi:hypothetical protein